MERAREQERGPRLIVIVCGVSALRRVTADLVCPYIYHHLHSAANEKRKLDTFKLLTAKAKKQLAMALIVSFPLHFSTLLFFHLWQACCLESTACGNKPENRVTVAKPLVASISWITCYKINTVSLIYKRSEVGTPFQGHISPWGDQFAHFTFTFYISLLARCCLKDKWSN